MVQTTVLEAGEYISRPLKVPSVQGYCHSPAVLEGRPATSRLPWKHAAVFLFLTWGGALRPATNHPQVFLSGGQQQRMGEPIPRDATGKGEFAARGGGGYSVDLGIELEGPRERAEISSWSARDLLPGCLVLFREKWGSSRL